VNVLRRTQKSPSEATLAQGEDLEGCQVYASKELLTYSCTYIAYLYYGRSSYQPRGFEIATLLPSFLKLSMCTMTRSIVVYRLLFPLCVTHTFLFKVEVAFNVLWWWKLQK